ncbi:glycosyltransferase [Gammaproteobacteria bacterium]|nr:glycosyltransferase [Gammaproteobacteria bacterium]
MKSLIVLPAFNEKENIANLLQAILSSSDNFYIVLVDDNSPDGTFKAAKNFKHSLDINKSNRLHLISRCKKDGRGSAVWEGFKWGLEYQQLQFDCFIEMDCDFSHDPKYLKTGIQYVSDGNDAVLASKYPDGKTIGWPFGRVALSFLSNMLCRVLIKWSIGDYTNGYRFYSKRAIEILINSNMVHKGYINLSESLAILLKNKVKIKSFPIVFVNRLNGESKTTFKELKNSLLGIFKIAYWFWFQKK